MSRAPYGTVRVDGRIPAWYATAATRKRRARLKAEGKCQCGDPVEPGYQTCNECRSINRAKGSRVDSSET
jgi:hypothetical protein